MWEKKQQQAPYVCTHQYSVECRGSPTSLYVSKNGNSCVVLKPAFDELTKEKKNKKQNKTKQKLWKHKFKPGADE